MAAENARLRAEALKLVLDAAEMHRRNDHHWRPVHGPAYFEANLGRDENRRKLGEAITLLASPPSAASPQEVDRNTPATEIAWPQDVADLIEMADEWPTPVSDAGTMFSGDVLIKKLGAALKHSASAASPAAGEQHDTNNEGTSARTRPTGDDIPVRHVDGAAAAARGDRDGHLALGAPREGDSQAVPN